MDNNAVLEIVPELTTMTTSVSGETVNIHDLLYRINQRADLKRRQLLSRFQWTYPLEDSFTHLTDEQGFSRATYGLSDLMKNVKYPAMVTGFGCDR